MQSLTAAFLAGSVGAGEVVILFALVLVLFGPRRLPSLAREIGSFLARLQRTAQDFRDQIMNLDSNPSGAPKAPSQAPQQDAELPKDGDRQETERKERAG